MAATRTLPRSWPPTRDDELEMLRTPAEWPHRPRLPLKRSSNGRVELGFVLEDSTTTLYLGTIFQQPAHLARIHYGSHEQLLDAGWQVD